MSEIRQVEKYLLDKMSIEDSLVFEAQLITNPVLKLNVYLQQKIYLLLKLYRRKIMREEAQAVHNRLFSNPTKARFQETIAQLFKN